MTPKRKKALTIVAAAAIAVAALVVYGLFDPGEIRWFPKCPIYVLTGLKCPGCGSQRMVHALLEGDVAEAFRQNALLLVMLPLIVALIVAEALRTRYPRAYMALNSNALIISVLLLMVVWAVARNLFGW